MRFSLTPWRHTSFVGCRYTILIAVQEGIGQKIVASDAVRSRSGRKVILETAQPSVHQSALRNSGVLCRIAAATASITMKTPSAPTTDGTFGVTEDNIVRIGQRSALDG
jgi:hypothetical protein